MTRILGYARVSITGQDLDAQLAALSAAAGVSTDRVFTDKLSGSARTVRPGLAAMLDYARPGDSVVVTAIDRLGRSVADNHPDHRRSPRASNPVARLTRRDRHRHPDEAARRSDHGQSGRA
jgi:hypothetical protein